MSDEIESLRSSIAFLRWNIFNYETALKGRILALYREAYDTSDSSANIINGQIATHAATWVGAHDRIRNELRDMVVQLDQLRDVVDGFEGRLQHKNAENSRLSTKIHDQKTTTNNLNATIREKDRELARLSSRISNQDATICNLQESANTLRAEGNGSTGSILDLRTTLATKEQLLVKCQSKNNRQAYTIATLQKDVRNREVQVQACSRDVDEGQRSLTVQAKTIGALHTRIKELEEGLKVSRLAAADVETSGNPKVVTKTECSFSPVKTIGEVHPDTRISTFTPEESRLTQLISRYVDSRKKQTEEVAGVKVLIKAIARSHELLDAKDASLKSVTEELKSLKDNIQSRQLLLPTIVDTSTQTEQERLPIAVNTRVQSKAETILIAVNTGIQTEHPSLPEVVNTGVQTEQETIPIAGNTGSQTEAETLSATVNTEFQTRRETLPMTVNTGIQTEMIPSENYAMDRTADELRLQKMSTLITEQALEIRGLRSSFQRPQRLGSPRSTFKRSFIIRTCQPRVSSRSYMTDDSPLATESEDGESSGQEGVNEAKQDHKKVLGSLTTNSQSESSTEEDDASGSSTEWHETSQIVETPTTDISGDDDSAKVQHLLNSCNKEGGNVDIGV